MLMQEHGMLCMMSYLRHVSVCVLVQKYIVRTLTDYNWHSVMHCVVSSTKTPQAGRVIDRRLANDD